MIEIPLPASKSLSNRWLILQALSGEKWDLQNLSEADDTQRLQRLLSQIDGSSDPNTIVRLDCGNAGTILRFLCVYLLQNPGSWDLGGCHRLAERPLDELIDTLTEMGGLIAPAPVEDGEADHLGSDFSDCQSICWISGQRIDSTFCHFSEGRSSQFISAVLLGTPALNRPFTLFTPEAVHRNPYVLMTARILEQIGLTVLLTDQFIQVSGTPQTPSAAIVIESDWSSASYAYAALALKGEGEFFLPGLRADSLQGDACCATWMEDFGVYTTFTEGGARLRVERKRPIFFEKDFRFQPDLAPTFAVLCALSGCEAELSGLKALRDKECDRLETLHVGLTQIGTRVELLDDDSLIMWSSPDLHRQAEASETHNDHRMVMSFWLCSLIFGPMRWPERDCVKKSFPDFFACFENL